MEGAFWGIFLPFAGTALGAGSVFFLRRAVSPWLQQGFMGFAAGVKLGGKDNSKSKLGYTNFLKFLQEANIL